MRTYPAHAHTCACMPMQAFWVVDIFLFNLEELLWSWKLFEYAVWLSLT